MKYIFIFTIFVTLFYNMTVLYVDTKIKKDVNVYTHCKKVWASRGLYESYEERNSITSIQRAFSAGFLGVEVDAYYDTATKRFIVSHNKPHKNTDGTLTYTLKEGKILTLEELFSLTGKGHYFWLDFKNLDRLNKKETQHAIERLEVITKQYALKQRVYVEGSTPQRLQKYEERGFYTLFSFHPLPESMYLLSSISSNLYKIAYYFFDLTAVALPYGDVDNPKYSAVTQQNLAGIPTFLFHVPDNEVLLKNLVQKEDVRVMLVGRDKSLNRVEITNCKAKEN